MKSITTSTDTPILEAVVLATEERKLFWHHYEDWVRSAREEELMQLQAALDTYGIFETQSLACLIRKALQDEVQRRMFPASFLAPLQAANWPGAVAHG